MINKLYQSYLSIFQYVNNFVKFLFFYFEALLSIIFENLISLPIDNKPSHCCVIGAHNKVNDNYALQLGSQRGQFEQLCNQMECYFTWLPEDSIPKGIIIMFSDIFGPSTGKHTWMCDWLSNHNYFVAAPDFLGPKKELNNFILNNFPNFKSKTADVLYYLNSILPSNQIFKQKIEIIMDKIICKLDQHCKQLNIQLDIQSIPVYSLGFCWGTYPATKLLTNDILEDDNLRLKTKKGIAFHPHLMISSGNPIELVKQVNQPLLFCPGYNDPPYFFADGSVTEILNQKFGQPSSILFPDMCHGWMTRGIMCNQFIERDTYGGLEIIKNYFTDDKID